MPPKYEALPIKFNMENEQDILRWNHIKDLKNRQAYIKDLILLDIMFGLFKGGIQNVVANRNVIEQKPPDEQEKDKEEKSKPDLSKFDTSGVIDF
jgi:hypothetical protein